MQVRAHARTRTSRIDRRMHARARAGVSAEPSQRDLFVSQTVGGYSEIETRNNRNL